MSATSASCSVIRVADVIGKKWTIVILQEVALNGDRGFNAMFRRMRKISPKLLSQRLRDLEQQGIIEKKVFAHQIPVRTSYTLTKKGKELYVLVEDLKKWNLKYSPQKVACAGNSCVDCPLY